MMRWMLPALALGLAACSAEGFDERNAMDEDVAESDDGTDVDGSVRLDVFPPQTSGLADSRGEPLDLRPQTFVVESQSNRDLQLTLTPALTLSGLVEGRALTPWPAADLPSADLVLDDAEIRFGLVDSVQQPRTETDREGVYTARVIPSDVPYDVAVVPSSPDVPVRVQRVTIDGSRDELDLFVDAGVPVWGTLTDDGGEPLPGMQVVAIDPNGLRSAPDITDSRGRYELNVASGQSTTLEASPTGTAIRATVRRSLESVPANGIQADLVYGNVVASTITGVVYTPRQSGDEFREAADDAVRVRVIATSLDGFEGDARYELEVGTDNGRFSALAPLGTYRVEVSPLLPDGPSPLVVEGVRLGVSVTTVNDLELPRKVARQGVVADSDGFGIGGADIDCTEVGFGERTFSTTADPTGAFVLLAPLSPMTCTVTPPLDEADRLAVTNQRLDNDVALDPEASWTLRAREGSVITGFLRTRLEPVLSSTTSVEVPNAVVQVSDFSGNLLGIAVTDENGAFRLRVAR